MVAGVDVGIGIIGSGAISEVHARAIQAIGGARVVGFFSRSRDAAQARAGQFGAVAYTRVEDLVEDPAVHAVSICTPSGAHMEPAILAAKSRKHVMVEKPIEISLDRVDAIVAACRENGVKLGSIFPRRLLPSSRALKKAISEGRFGSIALADVYIKWYRTQEYYAQGGWHGTRRYDGGGALMNQGIHGVDLLQWLMGGIETVSAFTALRGHTGLEVEDVAVASVRFRSGALGIIEATTGAWPGDRLRVEIAGDQGSVVMEDEAIRTWKFRQSTKEDEEIAIRLGPREGMSTGGSSDPRAIDDAGHVRQFADFVAAIRDDRAPAIDGVEARAAVAVVTAVYRSAEEGRAVAVER
jgi:UDP-N-acetyl-2-amino-2-deoxyglucuronate dehydrogenase